MPLTTPVMLEVTLLIVTAVSTRLLTASMREDSRRRFSDSLCLRMALAAYILAPSTLSCCKACLASDVRPGCDGWEKKDFWSENLLMFWCIVSDSLTFFSFAFSAISSLAAFRDCFCNCLAVNLSWKRDSLSSFQPVSYLRRACRSMRGNTRPYFLTQTWWCVDWLVVLSSGSPLSSQSLSVCVKLRRSTCHAVAHHKPPSCHRVSV
jgi:hypothetical protein